MHLAMDPMTILGNTLLPEHGISVLTPEMASDLRITLFEQLVLSIGKSNAMKK